MKVLLYQFHLKKKELTFAIDENILGDYGEYWKLSSYSCKKYAEKWGWDYIFDNPSEEEWKPFFIDQPQFEQFRSIEYLQNYDAVLFVDSDVLIKPESPNIIEEYKENGANLIVNTTIGNHLLEGKKHSGVAVNSGVVLWFNDSINIEHLNNLKPDNYRVKGSENVFLLGSFIESRKHLKWWEQLEDFKPFIGKFKSGFYNDDKFLTFLISIYNIPTAHLNSKYNYRIWVDGRADILSDDCWFIHYTGTYKSYMEKHFNIIME